MGFPNWLGDAIDIYKSISQSYDTKEVPGDARTPNEAAQAEGEGWKAGWWDDDGGPSFGSRGIIRIHRKRQ